jgi:hypothetical protein
MGAYVGGHEERQVVAGGRVTGPGPGGVVMAERVVSGGQVERGLVEVRLPNKATALVSVVGAPAGSGGGDCEGA